MTDIKQFYAQKDNDRYENVLGGHNYHKCFVNHKGVCVLQQYEKLFLDKDENDGL